MKSAETRLQLSRGYADIYAHAVEVPAEFWLRGFADTPKDLRYYQLLEETMRADFDYRYVAVFSKKNEPLALQPLVLARQDLVASAGATLSKVATRLRRQWPGLFQTQMLLAGCLVGDGKTGLIGTGDAECAIFLVAEAIEKLAKSRSIRLVAFKDFPASTRTIMRTLYRKGYARLAGFPSLTVDLNFKSFDEYMELRLSRVTRKNLRRKFRAADTAALSLEVRDSAREVIDEIYPLYRAVAERSHIRFETFSREYFLQAATIAPKRFRYFIWRYNGRAVAFSFCTIWGGTIYDNDIGLDYDVAHEFNLYYVTFRDLINWSVKQGLRRYASAPFNYDPKLRLRLELQPVDLYVKHTVPLLNALLRRIAPLFEPARTDPILRQHLHVLK